MDAHAHLMDMFTTTFMPHGYCFLWIPSLVALHVFSDGLIALSYMIIPICLAYLVYKRKDIPYGWIFFCFCAFIVACGTTHIMEIWTLWHGDYWVSGFIKAATGIISFTTAMLLIWLIPTMLKLPSPSMLKHANQELEKSERKFQSILEGAPDAMIIANQRGEMVLVNAQTQKIFGYAKADLIGKNVEFLIPQQGYFQHTPSRPLEKNVELYGVRENGEEFPIEISLSPLETNEGILTLAAVRDVTDKKNIEKILVDRNAQLENANLVKDQFLTHMSHELRTPLNGIIAMTQLLLISNLSREQEDQLAIINESEKHLLAVINKILDFSKLEAGKANVSYAVFNLRSVIHSVVAVYETRAQSKGVSVACMIDAAVPENFCGDEVKIRQVFSNILDNAEKFTEKGRIDISVSCDQVGNMENRLLIDVVDTGIGINADVQARLFSPFTQGDASMTRKYGGTGLGLAISKNLVELMGGAIHFENTDKGSHFYFTIPFAETSEAVVDKNSLYFDLADVANMDIAANASVHILVVEDNKLNQKTLLMTLEKFGFNVSIVSSGQEALEAIKTTTFDVILMDCQMPLMDGYETTQQIRHIEQGKRHTPIIGVTAHALVGDRQKCLNAGMDDYISKPFNIMDLHQLIRQKI